MTSSWFQIVKPVSLVATEFYSISDRKIKAQVAINDAVAILKLMKRIEKIPAEGDEMVKPGPKASYHSLEFSTADMQKQEIVLINDKFKTPTTALNSKDDGGLFHDLESLLHPSYGKNLLKIKGLEIKFKDFSIIYDGIDEFPDPALTGGPTLGPTSKTYFTVLNSEQKSQKLEIFQGQVPPQPVSFKIKNKNFILSIFGKNKIYPEYFQVTLK